MQQTNSLVSHGSCKLQLVTIDDDEFFDYQSDDGTCYAQVCVKCGILLIDVNNRKY